jgi:glycerate-2-kinase
MLFINQRQIIENGQNSSLKEKRKDVLNILSYALESVDPFKAVLSVFNENKFYLKNSEIDISNFENIYLIGFGKASVRMAQAICNLIEIKNGVIVTNEINKYFLKNNINIFTGGHPIPNTNSIAGTEKILEIIENCKKNDLLIVLISGGGSALLCKPRTSLKELQLTTDLLLKSGAEINEINTIRKHLSFVKGGFLVKYAKCKILSLIISDIIDDPLESISSGPTYPDSSTYKNAQDILYKYNLYDIVPIAVRNILKKGINGDIPETPKNYDSIFDNVYNFIIANNKIACNAAKSKAKEIGYETKLLTTSLKGEAKDVGRLLIEKFCKNSKNRIFISGGETTVKVTGDGKGGRNQEMVLGSIQSLDGKDYVFASFATDGVDGNSNASGAIADGFSYNRATKKNIDPKKYLKNNNSYEFFKILGDLIITGPTGTNVMDIQIVIT